MARAFPNILIFHRELEIDSNETFQARWERTLSCRWEIWTITP